MQHTAEMDAVATPQHLEAIENASADVPGSFERIGAIGRDEDRLLTGFQSFLENEKPAPPNRRLPIAEIETGAK